MNNTYLVEERARKIGNFLVGRLLPFKEKRQVGPFTFIDHMGPVTLGKGKFVDIDQHPHIGLSTLTYLLSGSIHHRDSTGASQIIGPEDVGFMTSGAGVCHTERTPEKDRNQEEFKMHGYQIWVAMPKALEQATPNFQFIPKKELPTKTLNGLNIRMVAGSGFGLTSPLKVYTPLFMVDLTADEEVENDLSNQVEGEIALVVVSGAVQTGNQRILPGEMLVATEPNMCKVKFEKNTRVLAFGGQPFPEPRYLFWNFVSSSKETLEKAKKDWTDKKFPKVPGDETYIPLPNTKLK